MSYSLIDAVIKVLGDNYCPMKATEISDAILAKGYYLSAGATPERTISSYLTNFYSQYFKGVGNGKYELNKYGHEKYFEICKREGVIDKLRLKFFIESYKRDLKKNIPNEIYKWEAVKCFQDNWDINASNFAEMLERSLSKTDNLLNTGFAYPNAMIVKFARLYPDEVQSCFMGLYAETESIEKRINEFIHLIDGIHKKWNLESGETGENHYQNASVISTYLWLRFPNKYYIYKPTIAGNLFKKLGVDVKLRGKGALAVVKSYELYDEICAELNADVDLRGLLNEVLTEGCYPDSCLKTMMVDFAYYVEKYMEKDEQKEEKLEDKIDLKTWIYSPGEQARFWGDCLENDKMYLGWDELGDLSKYPTRDAMIEKMRILYGEDAGYKNDSLATWEFVNEVKEGDVIFAKKGRHAIVGRGVVYGEYQYDESREEYKHVRSVKWTDRGEWTFSYQQVLKTLTDITKYPDYVKKLNAMIDGEVEEDESRGLINCEPYTNEDFLREVYMDSRRLSLLQQLIKTKKNIILQGAPGVGKTYCAKRLAYTLMGEKNDSRIEFVQFHQNYSYEDFVMGYKPAEDGSFKLKNGVFYDFCKKAKDDEKNDYFFIIDEINRGNLSKIFGELLMLIEKDYRGDAVTMAYSDEKFHVPSNVHIIGMMNTADRSLAMIDYALRRRFSFVEICPGFESEGFKQYQENLNHDRFDKLIKCIVELNEKIRKDDSLGTGFEIGHSYFCNQLSVDDNWLQSVIEFDIIPMLQEYWFDDRSKVEEWRNTLESIFND